MSKRAGGERGGRGRGDYAKQILDSSFLRYAALSQRVQGLAGVKNKGQSTAQLALQFVCTFEGASVDTQTNVTALSFSHLSSSLCAGSSSCRTFALCSRASKQDLRSSNLRHLRPTLQLHYQLAVLPAVLAGDGAAAKLAGGGGGGGFAPSANQLGRWAQSCITVDRTIPTSGRMAAIKV